MRGCEGALRKRTIILSIFAWRHKGVEFDPFKIRVVYLLPQPKKLNRAAVSEPVFHNIFWLVRIFERCNIGQRNIILVVLGRKNIDGNVFYGNRAYFGIHRVALEWLVLGLWNEENIQEFCGKNGREEFDVEAV